MGRRARLADVLSGRQLCLVFRRSPGPLSPGPPAAPLPGRICRRGIVCRAPGPCRSRGDGGESGRALGRAAALPCRGGLPVRGGGAGGPLAARTELPLAGIYLVGCFFKENALVLPGLLVAAEVLLLPAD